MAAQEAILNLLSEIHQEVKATNGRVRNLEIAVAVLKWCVFAVGPAVLGALGFLFVHHMVFE
jgi:hypothetical protein